MQNEGVIMSALKAADVEWRTVQVLWLESAIFMSRYVLCQGMCFDFPHKWSILC